MKILKNCEIIEKKSRFWGFLLECEKEEEVKTFLEELKKEHKKATHFCWACRLKTPFCERAVDDGEPSGTAGRPILSVLQKKDLQNRAIIVVRYFGGVKLGAGGLLRAYAGTAGALVR